jgi:hypothetical protein
MSQERSTGVYIVTMCILVTPVADRSTRTDAAAVTASARNAAIGEAGPAGFRRTATPPPSDRGPDTTSSEGAVHRQPVNDCIDERIREIKESNGLESVTLAELAWPVLDELDASDEGEDMPSSRTCLT